MKQNTLIVICLSVLLCIGTMSCTESPQQKATERVWSDKPAYTKVFKNQDERGLTSDLYDNVWEGDAVPQLPRVPNPSPNPKSIFKEEGRDLQDEETLALTEGKYSNPERIWEGEPYPIGNGRIAASVFNGSGRDRYALNEVSFWSGGENRGTINSKGDKGYNVNGPNVGENGFGSYQPVGDLIVDFNAPVQRETFVREIDLSKGVVKSQGTRGGITVKSTAFCSYPDQVMVIRYKSDKKNKLDASLLFATQRPGDKVTTNENTLTLTSELPNGMRCQTKATIINKGGSIEANNEQIQLKEVTECTLIVAIETNYEQNYANNWRGEQPEKRIAKRMEAIKDRSYADLYTEHEKDYKSLFDRLKLSISQPSPDLDALTTPKRMEAYCKNPDDAGMEEILFNFGRYLMISTSRPGNLPSGLQGIWNGMIAAPWGNDYHSNINFQMVYWLPEVGNLSECHKPMIDYFSATRDANMQATRDYLQALGQLKEEPKGWIVYTSQNPFGGNGWQVNLPGSAWYTLHMWEHYAFTQDINYLREQAYPMMKEICHYWEAHLKTLGEEGIGFESEYKPVDVTQYPELAHVKEGTLVVPNGWSPETGPRGEDGVAHDQQIISELFLNTIRAAQLLGVDDEWAAQLKEKQEKLYPPQIGKKGNLMEWMIDRDPVTDHRHTSHLFGVYPGNTISIEKTPELARAARKSLEFRKNSGNSRRSWAWTWRAMLWARLQEGNKAHEMIEGLITYNMLDNLFTTHHIPLQIDGNYGIAAAMIEMLVQSHSDVIQLLPTTIDKWPSGSIKGAKARGNVEVDMTWENGKVTDWKLYSANPQPVTVLVNGDRMEITPTKK